MQPAESQTLLEPDDLWQKVSAVLPQIIRLGYIARMSAEFSRMIRAGHVHGQAQVFNIEVDAESRAALAKRFALPAIARLSGAFTLQHERGGIIAAHLVMRAKVTQTCVVSLEPFPATIAEESELRFVPAKPAADEEELDPESLEGPDEIPYENDEIDLGEALAEQLALALDPYPRKPGAELPGEVLDDGASPFTVLKGRFGKPD